MNCIATISRTTFGVLALLAFAASASIAQGTELAGIKWQLTHLNGVAVGTNKAFLEFDPKFDRFNGNAGCNRMFGEVKVVGRGIDFGAIGTTKMACLDPASNRTERSFTANLNKVKRFRRTNSTLELLNGRRTLLRFKASNAQSASLESKKWVVQEIGGKAVHVKGTMPFIVFDPTRSSAGGNTGCNVFGGSYASSGNTVRIYDTVSTMRACIEDERMTIERQFMDALQNASRFEINGERLSLYRGERLLMKLEGTDK